MRKQLEDILASEAFARSPQARRFLEYVVDCTLADDPDSLKAYTIGISALGVNSERSCPETTARMQASRVRRLLEKYYATEGAHAGIEVRLPTGSYVARFLPRSAARSVSEPPPGLVLRKFENLSGDARDEALCRGLGEVILGHLVQAHHLRVLGEESAQAARHEFSLTGSVLRAGSAVRVQCSLTDVAGAITVWSEHFDDALVESALVAGGTGAPGLLGVQDRLGSIIAARVGDPTIGAVARHRRGLEPAGAAGALRQFYRLLGSPSEENLRLARESLERALPLPWVPAEVHAAHAFVLGVSYFASPPTAAALLLAAEAHARTALAEDSSLGLAHLSKALVHYHHRERQSAERELERAVECEPASVVLHAIAGNLLASIGEWERGLELVAEARRRAPDLPGYLLLGQAIHELCERGAPERALDCVQELDFPGTHFTELITAAAMARLGRQAEARRAASRVLAVDPAFPRRVQKRLRDLLFLPEVAQRLLSLAALAGLAPLSESSPASQRVPSPGAGARSREIVIGILQSSTGPMAISERHLIDAALLAVEEINERGGVLGQTVRTVVEDGESSPNVFRSRAEKLLKRDRVSSVFGCWTSSSRKAVLPLVEAERSILWYPMQYEGLERSRHVVYTGSCLNQQIEPAVRWAMKRDRMRVFLVGSDYVFPRTANRLIRGLVEAAGGVVLGECYEPLGGANFAETARAIRAAEPDIVYNTINGSDNLAFFREFSAQRLRADRTPVMSFSFSEIELAAAAGLAEGHLACWSYFQSMTEPENQELVARFRARFGHRSVLSDPSLTAYTQVHLWKDVVERAGTLDTDAVLARLVGTKFSLGGQELEVRENNHVERPAVIGRATKDEQFEVIWRSQVPIAPQPWLGVDEANLVARDLVLGALGAIPELAAHNSELEGRVRHTPRVYS